MAFSSGSQDQDELDSQINIIPLVDVMLVLLIIFMISAPMMNDSVDVKLPKAQAKPAAVSEESVRLTIQKDNQIFIGKTSVKLDDLAQKLTAIFANREKKEIFVAADEGVMHGFIIKVMAAIQAAKVYTIAFETDPSK